MPKAETRKDALKMATRGMELESDIRRAAQYYEQQELAVIRKIYTPYVVVGTVQKGSIVKFHENSSVDFEGFICGGRFSGRHFACEAKQTALEDRFPLSNIEEHQIEYLRKASRFGAIACFMIRFTSMGETYLVPAKYVIRRWDNRYEEGAPKSIPYRDLPYTMMVHEGPDGILDFLTTMYDLIDPFSHQNVANVA